MHDIIYCQLCMATSGSLIRRAHSDYGQQVQISPPHTDGQTHVVAAMWLITGGMKIDLLEPVSKNHIKVLYKQVSTSTYWTMNDINSKYWYVSVYTGTNHYILFMSYNFPVCTGTYKYILVQTGTCFILPVASSRRHDMTLGSTSRNNSMYRLVLICSGVQDS